MSVTAMRSCIALMLASALACTADRSTSIRDSGFPRADAKGGATGAASSGGPTVTSTTPASAKQDTTLDVTVNGNGFKSGARATWSLAGDTTQVVVQSTKFVNQKQLTARITVPAGATLGSYDVVVANSDGKKGVGAELFTVLQGDPRMTWAFPLDDAALSIRSDRQFSDGTYSIYADGVCSVVSSLFLTGTGDNVFQMTYPKANTCGRTWTMVYPDGFTETLAYQGGVQILEGPSFNIPVGTTARRHMRFGIGAGNNGNPLAARCSQGLVFGEGGGNPAVGSDSVTVTRVDAATWDVASQPAPNDHAYCVNSGQLYEMQVRFRIIANRPVP